MAKMLDIEYLREKQEVQGAYSYLKNLYRLNRRAFAMHGRRGHIKMEEGN